MSTRTNQARHAEHTKQAEKLTGTADVRADEARKQSAKAETHGESAPLGSAPARLLHPLRERLVAPGSVAFPGRGLLNGISATASLLMKLELAASKGAHLTVSDLPGRALDRAAYRRS